MTKKQVVKVIAFCLIVCIMCAVLCDLFDYENTKNFSSRFYTYTQLEEDTVDAVYIGTSGVDRFWIGPQAYEEYGMTVYPLSTDSMPTWLYTSVMDYALKYQNPKLIILDTRAFCKNDSIENVDSRARRVLDSMEFGTKPFFKAAFRTMEEIHKLDNSKPKFDISYLLSIVKYHSKWIDEEDKILKNIGKRENKYAGFYMDKNLTPTIEPQTPIPYDGDSIEKIDQSCEDAFYEIVEYAKEKDIEILFLDTPQFKIPRERARINYVLKMFEDAGVDYLTYDRMDSVGGFTIDFDYDKEFYNEGHVNYEGAIKFTSVFAEYLDKNYDLPDRRNDENVKKYWDGRNDMIKAKIAEWRK